MQRHLIVLLDVFCRLRRRARWPARELPALLAFALSACSGEGAIDATPAADDTAPTAADDAGDPSVDDTGCAEPATWYADGDGDGWAAGDAAGVDACEAPAGHVGADALGDCDDDDPLSHPGGEELPGGGDEDCDGADSPWLIYVVERYDGAVYALDRGSGDEVWRAEGLGEMVGAAFGPDGALYVARYQAGTLARLDVDGGWVDVMGGLTNPSTVWLDPSTGTFLLTDGGADRVLEVDPVTGASDVLAGGFENPTSAVRRPGESTVYINDRGAGVIYALDGGALAPVASDTWAHSLAPAPGGGLYLTATWGALLELDPTSGATEILSEDLASPASGICLDPEGAGVLMSEHDNARVDWYDRETGEVRLFSEVVAEPWQCTSPAPPDADGDGDWAWVHGGGDCDDRDASVRGDEGC